MLGTAAYLINDKGVVVGSLGTRPNTIEEYHHMRRHDEYFMLNHSSVFYKKSAFLDVGGYKYDYIGAEDTELNSRIAESGAVMNLSEPLFHYRKHLGSFMLANTTTHEFNLLRIKENILHRRLGKSELTYEQFIELYTERLTASEMRRFHRNIRGKLFYRVGAINSANGHYFIGLFYLAVACLFDYRRVISGIRRRTNNSRDLSASN
jgi:hypothetical protein